MLCFRNTLRQVDFEERTQNLSFAEDLANFQFPSLGVEINVGPERVLWFCGQQNKAYDSMKDRKINEFNFVSFKPYLSSCFS